MIPSQRRAVVSGLIFIALGVMFLLEALEVFQLAPSTLWPILLIALGIGVISGIGEDRGDDSRGIR
jgi:hypothetical protein